MTSQIGKRAVTLVGAGTQGRRLAFMWSKLERPVYLVDENPQQLSAASEDIRKYRSSAEFGQPVETDWGRVVGVSTTGLDEAISQSWLVVECVPESLKLKRSVVKKLDSIAEADTIVASNSSSYTITEILEDMKVKHPGRFASLHSYWPPETPAIEIMGSEATKPEVITRLMEETRQHGFQPFHVKRTSTGYIYNRIWAAIKREALMVLDEGVATAQEIDEIYKSVLKTPKGPCEQMDIVGLDVVLDIENHYAAERGGLPTTPRKLLQKMVDSGKLGVKSGEGFYVYNRSN